MLFLMAAFWCIYEIGYMENDRVAEEIESHPRLSPTYQRYSTRISYWQPWGWALFFSLPGIALLQLAHDGAQWSWATLGHDIRQIDSDLMMRAIGGWFTVLAALRLTYLAYNWANKPTRIWIYPILQAYKCFGFLALTTTNLVGSLLFFAQCLSRWIAYIVYRNSDRGWYRVSQVLRCLIFASCILAVAVGTQEFLLLSTWQTWIILIVICLKARREYYAIFKETGWITDPTRS